MNRDVLVDMGHEDVTVFRNPDYDEAIIGIATDNRVVYSYSKMVESLMAESEDMSYEEASEFIDYNTIRALPYIENAPVIMYDFES